MFISRLIRTVEHYDPYGMHRLNGMKVVYLFFALSLGNVFFNIPNVYFYYFYIPITSMSAEVVAERVEDKYKAFITTMLGSCLMVLLFNMVSPYPLFFLFSVFVCSSLLYLIALRWGRFFIPLVPIILGLAAYSFLYADLNMNFHMAMNNAVSTLFALAIALCALILFPQSYYYRLWLRAFILLLQEILNNLIFLDEKNTKKSIVVQGHTRHLMIFSMMLPRKLPTQAILKVNLLVNRLHLESCVEKSSIVLLEKHELNLLIQQLKKFIQAVSAERPYMLSETSHPMLLKLVKTWNYLCLKI